MYWVKLKGFIKERRNASGEVDLQLPKGLFYEILRAALASAPFDEAWYLERNPDVAKAVSEGQIPSGKCHFLSTGYFENRLPHRPDIDEEFYLNAYPDIKAAIQDGIIKDPVEHFMQYGLFEGRQITSNFSLFKK